MTRNDTPREDREAPRPPAPSTAGAAWAVLRLVLVAAYFVVVTPVALVLRLLRLLPFTRSFRSQPSYWKSTTTDERDRRHFERQS